MTLSLPDTKFSGVFERRTATGSNAFSLFISLDATIFVLMSVITHIETICPKILTKPRPKNAKRSLSVGIELLVITGNNMHLIFKRSDEIHHCKQ